MTTHDKNGRMLWKCSAVHRCQTAPDLALDSMTAHRAYVRGCGMHNWHMIRCSRPGPVISLRVILIATLMRGSSEDVFNPNLNPNAQNIVLTLTLALTLSLALTLALTLKFF